MVLIQIGLMMIAVICLSFIPLKIGIYVEDKYNISPLPLAIFLLAFELIIIGFVINFVINLIN